MRKFSIPELDNQSLELEVGKKLFEYKSTGLYDSFYEMMVKTCLVLDSSKPKIKRPAYLLLASDHGFVKDANTHKKVYDHLDGKSLLALMCKSSGFHLKTIDLGVNHSFESSLSFWLNHGKRIVDLKISHGTKNFKEFPAMTTSDCQKAIDIGIKLAVKEAKIGANIIALDSYAKGGEESARIIAAGILEKEIQKGELKLEIEESYKRKLAIHPKTHDPITLICLFGGYELACMIGVLLQAASQRKLILIQGFKASLALYIASLWNRRVVDFVVVCSRAQDEWESFLHNSTKVLNLNQSNIDSQEQLSLCSAIALIKSGSTILKD